MALGPELLTNGNMSAGVGIGASSLPGPGWTTSYTVPSGGNLFAGAGAGQATWMFYDESNMGTVFNGQSNPQLLPRGPGKAFGVNVGPNLTTPIIRWANVPLVNGKEYIFSGLFGIVNAPFSMAIAIDGVNQFAVVAPTSVNVWTPTSTRFTFTGTTGLHTVGLQSNSGVAGGNDHAIDSLSLRMVDPDVGCCTEVPVCYVDLAECASAPTQTLFPPARFDYASLAYNNSPYSISGEIVRLRDGDYGGAGTGFITVNSGSGVGTFADIGFDLIYTTPRDRVRGFRVYHGYGGVLNDGDGMGPGSTITVYDAANSVLFGPVPMVTGNGGQGWETPFGVTLNGVSRVRVDGVYRSATGGSIHVGIREMELFQTFHSTLDWVCGSEHIQALIEGDQQGVTLSGGTNLIQTNGPHTLTFSNIANPRRPFSGTIITNTPGDFSSLNVSDINNVITLSGNHNVTFDINWTIATSGPVRKARVDLSDNPPSMFDLASGVVLDPATIGIVPCNG